MNDLYREDILEHFRNPSNFGKIDRFDATARQLNPFCGDEIEVFLAFDDNKVKDISFQGKGCAISLAAMSLLTETVIGKTKKELTKFSEQDMLSLLKIEVSETRKKCAFLGLSVLKDCLYATKSKS